MFKLIGKKIITILHSKRFLIWVYTDTTIFAIISTQVLISKHYSKAFKRLSGLQEPTNKSHKLHRINVIHVPIIGNDT